MMSFVYLSESAKIDKLNTTILDIFKDVMGNELNFEKLYFRFRLDSRFDKIIDRKTKSVDAQYLILDLLMECLGTGLHTDTGIQLAFSRAVSCVILL